MQITKQSHGDDHSGYLECRLTERWMSTTNIEELTNILQCFQWPPSVSVHIEWGPLQIGEMKTWGKRANHCAKQHAQISPTGRVVLFGVERSRVQTPPAPLDRLRWKKNEKKICSNYERVVYSNQQQNLAFYFLLCVSWILYTFYWQTWAL